MVVDEALDAEKGKGEKGMHEQRRDGILSLVGIASVPDDFDMDDLKTERLSRCEF